MSHSNIKEALPLCNATESRKDEIKWQVLGHDLRGGQHCLVEEQQINVGKNISFPMRGFFPTALHPGYFFSEMEDRDNNMELKYFRNKRLCNQIVNII